MVFGKISVETPKYEVIKSTSEYEIRKYPASVVAEVTYDPKQMNNDKDAGFKILANYIGVFGQPQNAKPEQIAMTAPVITTAAPAEKIAMTSPVITNESPQGLVTMQFKLPSKYTKAEEAPKPLDEKVVIKEEAGRKYGVVKFSGRTTDQIVNPKVERLKSSLEKDGYTITGNFLLARYNPPWTLPPFRTNEIMLPVE